MVAGADAHVLHNGGGSVCDEQWGGLGDAFAKFCVPTMENRRPDQQAEFQEIDQVSFPQALGFLKQPKEPFNNHLMSTSSIK